MKELINILERHDYEYSLGSDSIIFHDFDGDIDITHWPAYELMVFLGH